MQTSEYELQALYTALQPFCVLLKGPLLFAKTAHNASEKQGLLWYTSTLHA